ncbi:MAG: chloride channel protein [Pseudomonadales bacterium]|nr:chloride channel protein [Pseudomonadales bacterium]
MNFDLDRIRERLSTLDAVPLLAVLGILAGLSSGLIIILFRMLVELVLALVLPENSENFEGLSPMLQGSLPLTCAILLGAAFHYLSRDERRTGVSYVIERFNLYQGAISGRSLLVQFFGAAATLIGGLSMGREGPAVHLGAAGGSLLGQWARLPNNSVRILTGCGCAAAISASFNTPIAGVIFAMEVIMMEYSISTFIPIILASVVGASLTRAVYGHEPAFTIPTVQMGSLMELPFVVLCGVIIGCLAAALIFLSLRFYQHTHRLGIGWRFFLAGVVTAGCGYLAPEILGIGYDSVDAALAGSLAVSSLLLITCLKLLATSACVGAGLPAGVIGPSLFMGAMAGGLFGELGGALLPEESNFTLYVLLGMAGMMAATLEAPLAALMALLELTFEPNIIFPGMLVVVISSLITSQVFRQKGIFQAFLEAQGIALNVSPLARHLHRVGVAAVMDRNIRRVNQFISREEADDLLKKQPNWLLIEKDGLPTHFMPAAELATYLAGLDQSNSKEENTAAEAPSLNLLEIPAKRDNVTPVLLSATLHEALDAMKKADVSAVYVRRMSAPNIYRVFGVVRKQDIEHYYQI